MTINIESNSLINRTGKYAIEDLDKLAFQSLKLLVSFSGKDN